MAATNSSNSGTGNTYDQNENNAKNWYNHLAAALMMGRANPQTMLGYLIGNKLLKQPFEKWVNQIQGRVPDQTETPTTENSANPYFIDRAIRLFGGDPNYGLGRNALNYGG